LAFQYPAHVLKINDNNNIEYIKEIKQYKYNYIYTDIAVCNLTCHTSTGTHMQYRITLC